MEYHLLTIIIPCYNCASTLKEAVYSIYTQNLQVPFEVVMVDDASTDNTWEVMQRLAKEHKEIKLFQHQENLGGGAARNTAIRNSSGDIIFCLDSDDILTPNFLNRMIEYLDVKKCDGVGISRSIKFRGKNVKDVAYVTQMGYQDQKIPFESLFENATCPLYSTFLHTRRAYDIAGGYPTHHGFDTQGFAFRFLANGLVAYGCPNTSYLHRVGFNRSYYVREYEEGKASHNWFKIFDEFIFLFKDALKEKILNADLNDHRRPVQVMVNGEENRFVSNYKELIRPDIKTRYIEKLNNKQTKYDEYWFGSEEFLKNNFYKAANHFLTALKLGLMNLHVNNKLLVSISRLQGLDMGTLLSQAASIQKYQKQGSLRPLNKRILSKLIKSFEKHR